MKEQEERGLERAGAINEVVKLNLAVFARAASVHLSLSLARLSAAPSHSPTVINSLPLLSTLPDYVTLLFCPPSFPPSLPCLSAPPLTPRLLYRPFLPPPSAVAPAASLTLHYSCVVVTNARPRRTLGPRTLRAPPSPAAHSFFRPISRRRRLFRFFTPFAALSIAVVVRVVRVPV